MYVHYVEINVLVVSVFYLVHTMLWCVCVCVCVCEQCIGVVRGNGLL